MKIWNCEKITQNWSLWCCNMSQLFIDIIDIKDMIVSSIKCQKIELKNLKPILDV